MSGSVRLWIDPVFGASGDMLLGLLVDLGVSLEDVERHVALLGVTGWRIDSATVRRGGVTATRIRVDAGDRPVPRSWSEIDASIAGSTLPPPVRDGARKTFAALAEAEAQTHGVPVDEVHFHEVGAVDAVVDIVGAWSGWHLLGQPEVLVGRFGIGHGTTAAAHGLLPLPAPAVAELLTGWEIRPLETEGESVTPTGAALLTTLSRTQRPAPPAGRVVATGRGAGERDPASHPNVLSGLLVIDTSASTEMVTELITNVDDVTGEILGHAVSRLFAEGALDVWLTPIMMKKGRPAQQLTALCRPVDAARLREVLLAETGTLGVRQHITERWVAERAEDVVEVDGRRIRIKLGPYGAKPEYDDVAAVAAATGSPAHQIARRALAILTGNPAAGGTDPPIDTGAAPERGDRLAE